MQRIERLRWREKLVIRHHKQHIIMIFADARQAALNIVHFHVRPLDLFACQQPGLSLQVGFLSLTWGMFSDVDMESEKSVDKIDMS